MIMNSLVALFALISLVSVQVQCASIVWTGGAGNNLWNFANNWSPASVPTASDDVIISAVGGASVTVSQPAVANSLTIGSAQYPESVTLLSSLAVGSGGLKVQSRGSLIIQTNNVLPLSSNGLVSVAAGGTFNFVSGAIFGPALYQIQQGATLLFSSSALKLISGANFTNSGDGTIQSSYIQLNAGATFLNYGSLSAIGGITILSSDGSSTSYFQNTGTFTYEGQTVASPLNLQITTIFSSDLTISGPGEVSISGQFTSTANINIPSGALLYIAASGPTITSTFNTVKGQGSLTVSGNAVFKGSVSLTTLTVESSGVATFNGDNLFTSTLVSGKVTNTNSIRSANFWLTGGLIAGSGIYSVSTLLTIGESNSGNTNNFIQAHIVSSTNTVITQNVYILLDGLGNLEIPAGATFNVQNSAAFRIQTGTPVITLKGSATFNALGGYFYSDVNIVGGGVIQVTNGKLDLDTITLNASQIIISSGGFVQALNSIVSIPGGVSGNGGFNVSTLPSASSYAGALQVSNLGVISGPITVDSITADTLFIQMGDVYFNKSVISKVNEFDFYGGGIHGKSIAFQASHVKLGGPTPQTVDGVWVSAKTLTLVSPGDNTLITKNGGSINIGPSSRAAAII